MDRGSASVTFSPDGTPKSLAQAVCRQVTTEPGEPEAPARAAGGEGGWGGGRPAGQIRLATITSPARPYWTSALKLGPLNVNQIQRPQHQPTDRALLRKNTACRSPGQIRNKRRCLWEGGRPRWANSTSNVAAPPLPPCGVAHRRILGGQLNTPGHRAGRARPARPPQLKRAARAFRFQA